MDDRRKWRGGEQDVTAAANIGMPLSDDGFLNVSAEYSFALNYREDFNMLQQLMVIEVGHQIKELDLILKQIILMSGKLHELGWPLNNGFRSVWNAGMTVGDGVEAYSFGNYADTYGEYSFFLRAPGKSGL
ncbi:hypothetical protein Ct9H90mP29_01160 [bacterium]|nr:MAG: hypothetical protein Ct9H90mP29_01160 [bacterium]